MRGPDLPTIRTLDLVEDQTRYLQRKLYIHNAGHATFVYLGFLKGCTYIHGAAGDSEIMAVCEKAIEESGWAIEKEFGFPAEVIRAYRSALTDKCASPELPDEISRVVREPIRYGVCAALLSRIPGDEQSQRIAALLQKEGASCLEQLVGAPIPSPVLARIEALLPVVREGFAKRP